MPRGRILCGRCGGCLAWVGEALWGGGVPLNSYNMLRRSHVLGNQALKQMRSSDNQRQLPVLPLLSALMRLWPAGQPLPPPPRPRPMPCSPAPFPSPAVPRLWPPSVQA